VGAFYEIRDRLGLREIDLAVKKRALGKFARPRATRPLGYERLNQTV
jgi:hypothetical protein